MVSALSLVHFKNYAQGEFQFSSDLNFVVGRNGIGKTNLLDAIYYLCMARSHSTPLDRDTVEFGKPFFRLEADVIDLDSPDHVIIKVQPGRTKEISVGGEVASRLSDYVGFIPVVMLAPEDVVLIHGGGAVRRRFMDLCICQADKHYLDHLQRYQRLLVQRNALLRKEGLRANRELLMTYSASMSESAAYCSAARQAFIADLDPEFSRYYSALSDKRETPTIHYQSRLLESAFMDLARESLEKDAHRGFTTRGIHKDDMEILLDTKPAKRFGSQGQVKSLLIALNLGQAVILKRRTGKSPILLLDDIFDRLDDNRSRRLVDLLGGEDKGQVFISDASPERMRQVTQASGGDVNVIQLSSESAVWHKPAQNHNLHRHVNEEE